jgi:hypothetical protein
LREENKENVQNWVHSLKRCLDIFGFSEVWINGGVGDEKAFVKVSLYYPVLNHCCFILKTKFVKHGSYFDSGTSRSSIFS